MKVNVIKPEPVPTEYILSLNEDEMKVLVATLGSTNAKDVMRESSLFHFVYPEEFGSIMYDLYVVAAEALG